MKDLIINNIGGIVMALIVMLLIGYLLNSVDTKELSEYCAKPISQINLGDVLIIAIIHAFINRSEIKTK